ncbi:MAG TPA: glucosamine-6-phosphate deaminase [Lentisphaeria bacterium]|nr:MAG: glucosamine-6-phosphate deaminase [Lentisphaerae bacterium GWF2_50_93]HCE46819.1 glucosamine-6-phosphate deaminase [Lentisphaeria bacterium]
MEVIIRPDKEKAMELVAKLIINAVREKPSLVLGLATGNTMEPLYAKIAEIHKREKVDFSLCRTFNLDEYVGLKAEHRNSYRHYMNEHFFNKINIDLRNTHLPSGTAKDLDRECEKYEQKMKECGGIDFQLLGIGKSGHIGFNEPLSAFFSRTRVKALTPTTIAQNSPLFDRPEDMPKRAITMGVGTILEAKRIVTLVVGSSKAEILAKAVEGPVTSMVSASALQLHSKCVVIADEKAAANLQGRDYYRWIFNNEPEWDEFR